jgi:hypothetical protein
MVERFREATRELECDDDRRFEKRVAEIAKATPSWDPKLS